MSELIRRLEWRANKLDGPGYLMNNCVTDLRDAITRIKELEAEFTRMENAWRKQVDFEKHQYFELQAVVDRWNEWYYTDNAAVPPALPYPVWLKQHATKEEA